MKTLSFDAMLEVLEKLDPWLESLGIQIRADRWHQAIETVKVTKERAEILKRGGTLEPQWSAAGALFDAWEIYDIIRAFGGITSAELKEKLARALSGPFYPSEEHPKNSAARNAMFELWLAADWKNRGLEVELGEPDIRLSLGEQTFQVECKRPFSEHSVRANVEGAKSKLVEVLESPDGSSHLGFVAISLSRAFTKGNLLCIAPDGRGRDELQASLLKMLQENSAAWRLGRLKNWHERIVAVMFHIALPWDEQGQRLTHLSASRFIWTTNSKAAWETLEGALSQSR